MPGELTLNAVNWPSRPWAQAVTGKCGTWRRPHARAGSTAVLARDYARGGTINLAPIGR